MKKNVKKRALTLLEVVIALALAAILFSVLFGRLKHLFHLYTTLEASKTELFAQKHLHERLSLILHTLETSSEGKKEPSFSSKDGKELILRFDNGLEKNLHFSGVVEGEIALEETRGMKSLVLTLKGKNKETRKEYLIKGIKDAQFYFFDLTQQKERWTKQWQDRSREFPPLIRLEITPLKGEHEGENILFAFFLNHPDSLVIYSPSKPISDTKTGETK